MQLHVIQTGETLSGIAGAYDTTIPAITTANQIDENDALVVGQTLVIPVTGRFYWVEPGDTWGTIARRYHLSASAIAALNQLSLATPPPVGTRLHLPAAEKIEIETNAYLEPMAGVVSPHLQAAAQEASPFLTYLAPFSYHMNADGTLTLVPLDNLPAIASAHGTSLMMVVTNLEEGAFSGELGKAILSDETKQDALLDAILAEVARVGHFTDVHFDFEFLPPEERENYNQFLRKAVDRLHPAGLLVSTALAPKTSAEQVGQWYEAHDYRAHGDIVDFVVLMTYEWGYSGGPAMAVSPIGPVSEVVDYALTEMPAQKIMLGQNLYGYDWTLPFEPGGEYARAISPQQAIDLARTHNVPIQYDETAQAPFFFYTDDQNNEHEVWFEDGRSIQAKFDLIKDRGLRGISYWKLGLDFPQNWLLLNDQFTIRKHTRTRR
ncbi:glycoside hydrolase family 18 protein [Shouchella lonarensis]|uniref:Spore germination protein n=1 Tax=Shouchella lonarensis TaxID=1464122 RepID=A0A1G6H2B2_9BACI|nr:glycoside hydrolase family 18 protein [Shouchella lonarensis]SDB87556.1 spore germination protein [Shouchella lonarensis]